MVTLSLRRGATLIDAVVAFGIVAIVTTMAVNVLGPRDKFIQSTDRLGEDGAKQIQNALVQYVKDQDTYEYPEEWRIPKDVTNPSQGIDVCRDGVYDNYNCLELGRYLSGPYYTKTPVHVSGCEHFTGYRISLNKRSPVVHVVNLGKLPSDTLSRPANCNGQPSKIITVSVDGRIIPYNTGVVDFGSATPGTPVQKTFTITNIGTNQQIALQEPIVVPEGFSVVQSFAKTTLNPNGDTTTFILQMDADAPQGAMGGISFGNSDPVKNPFRFTVGGNGAIVASSSSAASSASSSTSSAQAQITVYAPSPDNYAIALNGFYDMGKTKMGGDPIIRTFRVKNTGSVGVTLSSLAGRIPLNCVLQYDLGDLMLAPNQETTFTLQKTTTGSPNTRLCDGLVDMRYVQTGYSTQLSFPFYVRAEAVSSMEQSMEIQVLDGTTYIRSNTDVVNFGSTLVGNSLWKTFTVRNIGAEPLVLTNNITVPSSFTVVSDFGSAQKQLYAGDSVTFRVSFTPTALGTVSGEIRFNNDDTDENPFIIDVEGTGTQWPGPEIQVLDGSTDVPWGGHVSFGSTVSGASVLRQFTVRNIGTDALTLAEPIAAPAGFAVAQSFSQKTLATGQEATFTLRMQADRVTPGVSGSVSFANNDTNENPFSFAVSGVVTPSPVPEIAVLDGSINLQSGFSQVFIASTPVGTPVTRSISVRNMGTAPLSMGLIAAPAGFTVNQVSPSIIAPGSFGTLSVTLSASAVGTYQGAISMENNDADEDPFIFTVRGNVTAAPQPEIALSLLGNNRASDINLIDGVSVVDFGATVVGTPLKRDFSVKNVGSAPLNMSGVELSYYGNSFRVVYQPRLRLNPGESSIFTIDTPAINVYDSNGAVTIRNNDSDENPFTFDFLAQVTPIASPEIEVLYSGEGVNSDDSYDTGVHCGSACHFGTTLFGQYLERTYTIRNAGTAPLVLSEVTLRDGVASNSTDKATIVSPPAKMTLQPSEETTYTIRTNSDWALNFAQFATYIRSNDVDEDDIWVGHYYELTNSPAPEIQVRHMITNMPYVQDDSGVVDLGTTVVGAKIQTRFQVLNVGAAALSVGPNVTVPTGFALSTPLSPTSVPANVSGSASEFAVELVAAAPGDYEGFVSFPNNDADENPFNFKVKGKVVAAPNPEADLTVGGVSVASNAGTVSFGSTMVGAPVEKTFTIHNYGNAALNVSTVRVPNGFSIMAQPGVYSIAPGGSTTFRVRMNAASQAVFGGSTYLAFDTNDADENPYQIALQGTVTSAAPRIAVTFPNAAPCPNGACALQFTNTQIGSNAVASLIVKNVGTATLSSLSANISGPFQIVQALPATLAAGASVQLDIRFTPVAVGNAQATLSITSNDTTNTPYAVSVDGDGFTAGQPYAEVLDGTTVITDGGTHALGTVSQGQAVERLLTVRNGGTTALSLSSLQVTGDVTIVNTFGKTSIPIGDSTTFRVRIGTSTTGAKSGTVQFGTNEAGARNPFNFTVTANVQAVASAPVLEVYLGGSVSPSTHCPKANCTVDFGTRMLGSPSVATLTVRNGGTTTLSSIALSGVSGRFSITQALGATSLAPGATTQFSVRYDAAALSASSLTMTVTSNDTANSPYPIVLKGSTEAPRLAEIAVSQGGVVVPHGAGNVDYGTITRGTTSAKQFTVRNIGSDALVLQQFIHVPAGFTVSEQFGLLSLAPGQSTTFSVRLLGGTAGTYGGFVRFHNSDTDESPFAFRVEGEVADAARPDMEVWHDATVIPDGGLYDFGATALSTPVTEVFTVRNIGSANLAVNTSGFAAGSAGFTVAQGLNQTIAPGQSATFQVRLDAASAGAKNAVLNLSTNIPGAKSVYAVGVSGTVMGGSEPDIQVKDGTTDLRIGAAVLLPDAYQGIPMLRTFTVQNAGSANLTLGAASVTGNFSIVSPLGSTTLAPGGSTRFTVALDAVARGTFQGTVTLTNNDPNENPFTFTVQGTVVPYEPDIHVTVEGFPVLDGTGNVDFGLRDSPAAKEKVFTVQNVGTKTLALQQSISVPLGYTVVRDFTALSLEPGQTASFTIGLTAASVGTYQGTVSFVNNDPDENPYSFTVNGRASEGVLSIDAEGAGPMLTYANYVLVVVNDSRTAAFNGIRVLDKNTNAIVRSIPVKGSYGSSIDRMVLAGNTLAITGGFWDVDGVGRCGSAAINLSTWQLLSWDPNPQASCNSGNVKRLKALSAVHDRFYYSQPGMLTWETVALEPSSMTPVAGFSSSTVPCIDPMGYVGVPGTNDVIVFGATHVSTSCSQRNVMARFNGLSGAVAWQKSVPGGSTSYWYTDADTNGTHIFAVDFRCTTGNSTICYRRLVIHGMDGSDVVTDDTLALLVGSDETYTPYAGTTTTPTRIPVKIDGTRLYLAGIFRLVGRPNVSPTNQVTRALGMAAIDTSSFAILPWNPATASPVPPVPQYIGHMTITDTHVWVSGSDTAYPIFHVGKALK